MPTLIILQEVSPNGRFIGLSLIISTFPFSTMGLIFLPKVLAIRRQRMGMEKGVTSEAENGVRIRGGSTPATGIRSGSIVSSQLAVSPEQVGNGTGSHAGPQPPRIQMVTIQ